MTRHGFVTPALLLLTAAISILAVTVLAASARRINEARTNQGRVQGREWCLGARNLPPGTTIERGAWRISVAADGTALAVDARGTYRIGPDGAEGWERRP